MPKQKRPPPVLVIGCRKGGAAPELIEFPGEISDDHLRRLLKGHFGTHEEVNCIICRSVEHWTIGKPSLPVTI